MKNFLVKAICKERTVEFDVEAVGIEDALKEGKEIAKMVFTQTFEDLKRSEIYMEVCAKI